MEIFKKSLDRRGFIKNSSLGLLLIDTNLGLFQFRNNNELVEVDNFQETTCNSFHYVRDTISINQELADKIQDKLKTLGLTCITMAARNINLKENVTFNSVNLFLYTDYYDGGNYTISIGNDILV